MSLTKSNIVVTPCYERKDLVTDNIRALDQLQQQYSDVLNLLNTLEDTHMDSIPLCKETIHMNYVMWQLSFR